MIYICNYIEYYTMSEICKWILKLKKDINVDINNEYYILTYKQISCKICKPNKTYKYYIVLPNDGNDYIWYDIINNYCITKFKNEINLINKIIKYIEKEIDTKELTNKLDNNIENNMEYYKIKLKLTEMINSSTTSLVIKNTGSIKKLYDEKIVGDIIINEYLECWKWCKENNATVNIINNNVYSWYICLNKLKTILNDEIINVIFEIHFHNKLYPNYPPLVTILSPKFKDKLNHRISNSKMTQLSYWTPTRNIKYIINRIKSIIEQWGKIKLENTIIKQMNIINIESNLIKLSSVIDNIILNDCIDTDVTFIKFNLYDEQLKIISDNYTKKTNYWKSGTGYGHSGSSSWNPIEYIELQKEKDKEIGIIIENIIKELNKIVIESEFEEIYEIISKSLLIQHLKQQFKNSTLLDIQNREPLFKIYMTLLETLATEKSIYLYDIKNDENENLYDILNKMYNILEISLKLDKDNKFIEHIYNVLQFNIFPLYNKYKKQISTNDDEKEEKEIIKETTVMEEYKKNMIDLCFAYEPILETNYYTIYKNEFKSEKGIWKMCQKRLACEISSLSQQNQLPINYESSIFLRIDEDNPMIMRVMITGPPDTPYDSGCYIFDIYTNTNYPKESPKCWFMNHGGHRFNPNLYANGKVCLSLLGTWNVVHSESEKWNEKTSSILQILISIQSQIFIEKPYFNEPGYDSKIGNHQYEKISNNYNETIRLYVMKSAIYDLLIKPDIYPQFKNVIINHFKIKKNYINNLCNKWFIDASDNMKKEYKNIIDQIKTELDKL